jgi:hypothetical protein
MFYDQFFIFVFVINLCFVSFHVMLDPVTAIIMRLAFKPMMDYIIDFTGQCEYVSKSARTWECTWWVWVSVHICHVSVCMCGVSSIEYIRSHAVGV